MNTKKLEELFNNSALGELLHKEEVKKEKKHTVLIVLAVIGALAAIGCAAYAAYRFFAPDHKPALCDDPS